MATPLAPVLTVFAPGHRSFERAVDRLPFVVGRDTTCDLSLDFPWISRRQLVIEAGEDGLTARSEGRAEVLLNAEVLVGPTLLAPGDRLDAGAITLLFDAARAHPIPLDDRHTAAPTLSMPVARVLQDAPDPLLVKLGQASVALATADDAEEVCTRAAQHLIDAIGARGAALVRLDGERASIIGARGAPITRASKALLQSALDEAATVAAREDGPLLVAPVAGPLRGALYATRLAGEPDFDQGAALFATLLAHLTGPAFEAAQRRDAQGAHGARLAAEREALLRDIERRGRFGALIGKSEPMRKLAGLIAKVAPTEATVLITGETGAGKELVAREVHTRSARAERSFLALNCAALPEGLIESELFGHRKGAFTGADRDRKGVLELAEGGTVFLDEVGELPLSAQAKVLRALDRKEVMPLGASRPVTVDVRLVAATHRDLSAEVAAGRFRQDLYYRLAVFPVRLPPLRERRDDLASLAEHFLAESAEARTKGVRTLTPRALAALARHPFPGNVRELAHVMVRAAILADAGEPIDLPHLPDELCGQVEVAADAPLETEYRVPDVIPSLRDEVARFERAVIVRELERDGWHRTRTAQRLDVSLRAFMDKLKKYEIKGPHPSQVDG